MWFSIPHVIHFFFAQQNQAGRDPISIQQFITAIEDAREVAAGITDQWQDQWRCMLGNLCFDTGGIDFGIRLYPILTGFGLIAAVVTVMALLFKIAKDLNEDNYTASIPELIWPLVVTFLLTPGFAVDFALPGQINIPSRNQAPTVIDVPFQLDFPYTPLARVTVEVQRLIRAIDATLLDQVGIVDNEADILTLQERAQVMTSAPATIQGFVSQCLSQNTSQRNSAQPPETLERCEVRTIQQSINLLKAYGEVYGEFPWITARIDDLEGILDALRVQTSDGSGRVDGTGGNPTQAKPASQILEEQIALNSWLIGEGRQNNTLPKISASIQLGFVQMLEAAWLLTALIGPIAVGASLLPVPATQRAGIKWLSGFAAIGSALLFYHLIIGLGSSVMTQAEPPVIDPTWFAVFLGYVAPVMALGLATGGGVALWNGLQSGVSPLFRL